MFADYHVHAEFSDDLVCPIEQEVKDAIGISGCRKYSRNFKLSIFTNSDPVYGLNSIEKTERKY